MRSQDAQYIRNRTNIPEQAARKAPPLAAKTTPSLLCAEVAAAVDAVEVGFTVALVSVAAEVELKFMLATPVEYVSPLTLPAAAHRVLVASAPVNECE